MNCRRQSEYWETLPPPCPWQVAGRTTSCKTTDGDEERLNVLTLFPAMQKHNTKDTVRQRTNKGEALPRLWIDGRPRPLVTVARRRTQATHTHMRKLAQQFRSRFARHSRSIAQTPAIEII